MLAETRPLRDFADRCRDDLPGIGSPLLNRLIVDTARELLRAGRLWRLCLDDLPIPSGDNPVVEFQADRIPECTVVHDVAEVSIGDRPIYGESPDLTVTHDQSTRWTRQGLALRLTQPESGTLTVNLVLMPEHGVKALPSLLWDEWLEVIECGVKARAMLKPGKDYSAPQLAGVHMDMWKTGLARARNYGKAGGATIRRRTYDPWGKRSHRGGYARW